MAACSCPTPLGLCVPFDMDDIILSFVDEVCLPLNRVNIARYLPVLPSFLELCRALPASTLENGIVGAFQPSSFVLQGLGSSLTRQVALQYLDVARHHHGKMEIEDESKIFFHGFKTTSGGVWFGAILFIALLAFLSETSGYILSKY